MTHKWTPGTCFSHGQVGHKSSECESLILKPVFCFTSKQQGHVASQYKEKGKRGANGNGSSSRKKTTARVFACSTKRLR